MKSWAKQLVPERYRLLRYELFEKFRYYPELVLSLGNRLECPFCRWRFRRFRPLGFDYPVLIEKEVVGASYHLNDVCPRCMSNARERLVYLYLKSRTSIFTEPLKVLHVAPESNLARLLSQQPNLSYTSADLFEEKVMARLDVMRLPFRDGTFDAVICNHVLEHVSDDRVAMAELHRILKQGGWALLQVPIALALTDTLEDSSATTEEDRIRVFGQRDHVRLYAAQDYIARLQKTGFEVFVAKAGHDFGEDIAAKYALILQESVFLCAKH